MHLAWVFCEWPAEALLPPQPHGSSANDLALLKAEGRFAPLPLAASRAVKLGGMV